MTSSATNPPPQPPDDLLHVLNSFWVMITGTLFAFWTSMKVAWNLGSHTQRINDRFDRLEAQVGVFNTRINELEDLIRQSLRYQNSPDQRS